MDRRTSQARSYSSPLRQRQQESTRRLIMETVASLIAEGRIHSFSVQDVVGRAGISYASVYRHFPTREKLLEAIYEWGNELIRSEMAATPRTLDEIPEWVKQSIPIAERHTAINQAVVAVLAALNINPRSRRRRDMEIENSCHMGLKASTAGAAGTWRSRSSWLRMSRICHPKPPGRQRL